MDRIRPRNDDDKTQTAHLTRAIEDLQRTVAGLSRKFDEFAAAFLNAKFPYGRPTDRWRRGSR